MNVFFFGGTFDPPHLGHKMIVKHCLNHCDKLVIIPNKKSPDKQNLPVSNSTHRLNMLKLLFNDPKICIDNYEIKATKVNYTYLTIEYLKNKYNNSDISMIIGLDQFANLPNWKEYEKILDKVNIVCFNRESNKLNDIIPETKKMKFLHSFNFDISSKEIRKYLIESKKEKYIKMLDEKVIKYIKENKLYVS